MHPQGNREGQRFFPDDEVYLRMPEVRTLKGRTVIIHSGMPDPNGGLVELEMLFEILKENEECRTEIFFAYFPYGMQDHKSVAGETNMAENLIRKLLDYYLVDRIYALDAHFAGQPWVARHKFINVSAVPLLKAAAERDYPRIKYLGPDAGSQRRAGVKGSKKKRTDSFQVDLTGGKNFDRLVRGNVIGSIDDLVETGGTATKFAELCRSHGASDMVSLITHGVLVSGIKRLKAAYSKLYLTNSIQREDSNVDVSGLIADSLLTK